MFDTERVFIKAWDYAGERIGIGKAGFMIHRTLGMNVVTSRKLWLDEFGERYNEQELRRHTREFLAQYYKDNPVPVKKGLYSLLDYLKNNGYKIALATSSPRYEAEYQTESTNTAHYFDAVVCGDMVSKSKPDPETYLKACELLCENPEDCYALEDSRSGLFSAYNAGCKPIMIPDMWQPDEDTIRILHRKFEDLEEVKNYLESIDIERSNA